MKKNDQNQKLNYNETIKDANIDPNKSNMLLTIPLSALDVVVASIIYKKLIS